MKTAIVIADGIKQVMFTPENESEKQALLMITPQDDISVDVKTGAFHSDMSESSRGYCVQQTKGGYLHAFPSEDSVMLVLTPKKK